MTKILSIMRAEIRTTLRRKSFVIVAFVVPLILAVVALAFGLLQGTSISQSLGSLTGSSAPASPPADKTGYVDTASLIGAAPAEADAANLIRYDSAAAAQTALDAGEIAGYYVVDPGYAQTGMVDYYTPDFSVMSDDLNPAPLAALLDVNLLNGDKALASLLQQPFDLQVEPLPEPDAPAITAEKSWISEMLPLFVTIILYMALMIPGSILINALIDEKKNRVMEVLMTSVTPTQMVIGKMAALGLLGLLQTALWLAVLWATSRFGGNALQIPPGSALPISLLIWALIYFLGGYAIYGAQFAGIGALAPDINQTKSVTWVVMMPIIVAYVFMTSLFNDPNSPLAVALSLFPLTSPIVMIGRLAAGAAPLWQAVLAALLQFVTAYGVILLTARLFKAQHLLTGQPLSLKSYYQVLFGRQARSQHTH